MPPSRFALHSFLCSWLLTSTCSGLWSGVRPGYTRAPADLCTYWFRWLPTNYFWSAANFSRLMLCGWQMSATINRLMLPAFPEPTTNPSIWVTVGSTGRQRHVCAGTHWSSYCLSLLGSLIQSLNPALHHARTPQHSTAQHMWGKK